jgi:hypothetical protein
LYGSHSKRSVARRPERWQRHDFDPERRIKGQPILVWHSIRKWNRHQPGRIDCGGSCRLLHHGVERSAHHRELAARIETKASVTFEKTDAGPTITKILLATTAKVPGADKAAFDKAAQDAKANCPISRLFKNNTEITLDAKLA